jgi:hypothetical protein
MKGRLPTLVLITLLACGPAVQHGISAASNDLARTELQVKAGFVYNFAVFTTWPTNPPSATTNAFVIGAMDRGEFPNILKETLTGRKIGGLPVRVLRCESIADAQGCRVLYLGGQSVGELAENLTALSNASVLTVGDTPEFTQQGGMVGLVKTNGRVEFHINVPAASRAELTMSAKLLRLAAQIVGTPVEREKN